MKATSNKQQATRNKKQETRNKKQAIAKTFQNLLTFLFFIFISSLNLFSQSPIGTGASNFDGWLYHRKKVTIGNYTEPSYNLLLVKEQNTSPNVFMQFANGHESTGMITVSPTEGLLIGLEGITGIINQQENADLIFKTDATDRAIIKNNGYVGIGIMNPQHDLHVHGTGTIGGSADDNGVGIRRTRSSAKNKLNNNNKLLGIGNITNISLGAIDEKDYAAIQLTNNTTGTESTDGLVLEMVDNNAIINLKEQGSITFRNSSNISLYISKDNNVGIGTTNPNGYKLAVKGTAHFVKIVVNIHDWSDEVFEDNYKLKSLYELENYIKTNKHLPGIPSESEVKKNGIDLADMNKRLLQKVEELTLYIIDLQKQIDELKKQVNKQ